MASLVPAKGSLKGGELRVGEVLSRLPENWLVYHEPKVGGLRPDFVVLAPELGLLVVEVKAWRAGSILGADSHHVQLMTAAGPATHLHPLEQAERYQWAVMDACRGSLWSSCLLHQEGPFAGRFVFPVWRLAIFTNLKRGQLWERFEPEVVERIFPEAEVVFAETLSRWEAMSPEELRREIEGRFRPFRMEQTLTAEQTNVLRGVIFPEMVLRSRDGGKPAGPRALKVLDFRQERLARTLGGGHRIIFGVAGSGKTILLMARARWLARENPHWRILLLCYNRMLAEWLANLLSDCPQVEVMNFHRWAMRQGVFWRKEEGAGEAEVGDGLLEKLAAGGGDCGRYDAVLIDEGQDFEPSWFRCALRALKDPLQGDLVVVADGSQGLYKRRKFTWKEVGVRASGRTISKGYELDRNYRNTREIAAVAGCFGCSGGDDEGLVAAAVRAESCVREGGARPLLIEGGSRERSHDTALAVVQRWLAGNARGERLLPEEIAVLYPEHQSQRQRLEAFVRRLNQLCPAVWLSDPDHKEKRRRIAERALKVQTIHSAKGLEYRAVIVLDVDRLPRLASPEEDGRLLYVALTRGEDHLVLICSQLAGFAAQLAATPGVVTRTVLRSGNGSAVAPSTGGPVLADPAAC